MTSYRLQSFLSMACVFLSTSLSFTLIWFDTRNNGSCVLAVKIPFITSSTKATSTSTRLSGTTSNPLKKIFRGLRRKKRFSVRGEGTDLTDPGPLSAYDENATKINDSKNVAHQLKQSEYDKVQEQKEITSNPNQLHVVFHEHTQAKLEAKLDVERGKILKNNFNVRDMFQAYRDIQTDYQSKAFAACNAKKWILLHEKDDIQVSMLQHPSDPTCPYVRMKAIIPVSVEECWNFLLISEWDKTMPVMDPFYEGVSIYGKYSYNDRHKGKHNMLLCRKRTKRLLVYGKRDLVFLSVTQDDPEPDGTWVSGTVSVICNQLIPRQHGYTRAFQDSIAFYKPIEQNTKTDLTIVCRIDLNDSGEGGDGGFIPMWFYVKTIGRTGAMSVHRMREALIQQKQQKQYDELKNK